MTKPLTHAGAVVFRKHDSRAYYLVVSSSDGVSWVLPKGHIDLGETPEIAALRELEEEAGVVGEIVVPLSVRHFKRADKEANILYFLIRKTGSTGATENRTVRWEEENAALALLSFPEAKEALLEGTAIVSDLD